MQYSELTRTKVGDLTSNDDGAAWLRVVQGKACRLRIKY